MAKAVKKKEKIRFADHEKVWRVLNSLSTDDFKYLHMQVHMANEALKLIAEFKLDPGTFCEAMGLSLKDYLPFIKGSFNYSVREIVKLQTLYADLCGKREQWRIENDPDYKIFHFPEYKYSQKATTKEQQS